MEKSKAIPARPVLGKGLASLLPGAAAAAQPASPMLGESSRDRHPGITLCGVDEIQPNPYQPRKTFHDETIAELAQSVRTHGVIQPLIVRKAVEGFQLIAGERRLRAAKLAGLKHVPVVIKRVTDKEMAEISLLENIQREDLSCLEAAEGYLKLIEEFEYTQENLAVRLGKDRSSIANHLRLLKLPAPVQAALRDGLLSFGHGKALAGLENAALVERLAREAIEKKWSVREIEIQTQKIRNLQQARERRFADPNGGRLQEPLQLRLSNLGRELSAKLSTKVQLRGNATRGKIIIEYFNAEDLDRLLTRIQN